MANRRKPASTRTKGRPGSRARGRGKGGAARRRRWPRFLVLLLLASVLGGVLYGLYLDQVVRGKFEGKRWAVPARVYARPLELYAGAPVDAEQLQNELRRLGYRSATHPKTSGSYSRNRNRFLLRTREFLFWDSIEPARYLEIRFANGRLKSLRDAASRKALALLRLEAPVIGSIYPSHHEDRILVKRQELPETLVQVLLAVEDRQFYQHRGLDPRAILRAAWANLRAGGVVQGGSTLTQQLIKNFYLSRERSFWRKANEAAMALMLEHHYDKDEILEAYANEIYLGQDGKRAVHGFGLASQHYFNRPLDELDLPRIALLVGLVRGPSYYDPRRYPERAKKRRDAILRMLAAQGAITPEQRDAGLAADLGVTASPGQGSGTHPAFLDLVRRQLHRDYQEEDLNSEGLRIFSTMDPWVQERAEQAVRERLAALGKRGGDSTELEAAAVVVSATGGEVLALIGGRRQAYAGFNRALDAVRPIGSLIKPVVYLLALSQPERYSLISLLDDSPVYVPGAKGKIWAPKNYDKVSHGEVPLHTALAKSYNQATVRLGIDLGVPQVKRTLQNLGVARPVDAYPSLLLGAVSLTPIEVAQVYQTLAAGGFRSVLRAIREVMDAEGRSLQRYPLKVEQAARTAAVYLLTKALQDVVREGTGAGLRGMLPASLHLAGKTGTTDDLRDSWFAGFSGDKVAVVWVGRDDNKPAGLTGSSGALRVWGDVMREIRPQPLEPPPPDDIQFAWVERETGMLADESCPGAIEVPFVRGTAPTLEASCRSGRVENFLRRIWQ